MGEGDKEGGDISMTILVFPFISSLSKQNGSRIKMFALLSYLVKTIKKYFIKPKSARETETTKEI